MSPMTVDSVEQKHSREGDGVIEHCTVIGTVLNTVLSLVLYWTLLSLAHFELRLLSTPDSWTGLKPTVFALCCKAAEQSCTSRYRNRYRYSLCQDHRGVVTSPLQTAVEAPPPPSAQPNSLISDSSLWPVHSLFQSEFCTQRHLLLSVSCSLQHFLVSLSSSSSCQCIVPHPSILPSIFPSVMCFTRQFPRNMWPIQLTFLLFTVCRIFLCSLPLCNTSSLTRSIQLTFPIILQHHISKLSKYFWSTARSFPVPAPHRAALQM